MNNPADELSALRALVNHRGVVEVMDLLVQGPHTVRELRTALGMRRPGVSRVLRVAAAHGVITTDGSGSWDEPLSLDGPIRLTGSGWRIVELLSSFAVWEALYQRSNPVREN
ncbi:hypothetical protein [Nocardia sp. NPDC020380]|uniref:hypothetical protein n=1 Tax=Nocardia sp. NPDC020380 TaxID=3364309 RepID=UPI0037B0A570